MRQRACPPALDWKLLKMSSYQTVRRHADDLSVRSVYPRTSGKKAGGCYNFIPVHRRRITFFQGNITWGVLWDSTTHDCRFFWGVLLSYLPLLCYFGPTVPQKVPNHQARVGRRRLEKNNNEICLLLASICPKSAEVEQQFQHSHCRHSGSNQSRQAVICLHSPLHMLTGRYVRLWHLKQENTSNQRCSAVSLHIWPSHHCCAF